MRYIKDMSVPASAVKSIEGFKYTVQNGKGGGDTLLSAVNISDRRYPLVYPRARRAVLSMYAGVSELMVDDNTVRIENGSLFVDDKRLFEGLFPEQLSSRLIRLGEFYVAMPQGLYCKVGNVEDNGFIAKSFSFLQSGVEIATVDSGFDEMTEYTVMATKPPAAEEGQLWAKPREDGGFEMKRYDGYDWRPYESYVMIKSPSLGKAFRPGDILECTGAEDVLGKHIRVAHSDANGIYFEGVVPLAEQAAYFSIKRSIPFLQQVTVCGGRAVGVYCGYNDEGGFLSKAYASALNDPLCWSEQGGALSADIGGDEPFTAIVSLGGDVYAFRESSIVRLRISGDKITASLIECEGVKPSARRSVVAIGNRIYYKGASGIYAFDGAQIKRIPNPFGKRVFDGENGTPAGAYNGSYYVCLSDEKGERKIYVYSTERGIWSTEDDPGVKSFLQHGPSLLAICKDGENTALVIWDHENADEELLKRFTKDGYPSVEGPVKWSIETGEIPIDVKNGAFPARVFLKARIEAGASVSAGCISAGKSMLERIVTVSDRTDGYFEIPMLASCGQAVRLTVFGRGNAEISGCDVEYREPKA